MLNSVITDYTYNPGTRTVTLTGFTAIQLERILYCIHLPTMVDLVKVGRQSLLPTASTNQFVINASVSLSGHSASDKLLIVYAIPADAGNRIPVSNLDGINTGSLSVTSAAVVYTLTNTAGLRTAFVEVESAGVGCTLVYETTNAAGVWVQMFGRTANNSGSTAEINSTTAIGMFQFPLGPQQFRIRVSVYGSGTVTVRTFLRSEPMAKMGVFVANSVAVPVDTELPAAAAMSDGQVNPTTPPVGAFLSGFNGTTFDRWRNNTSVTVEASSAKVASGNGTTQTNYNASGIQFFVNVTAVSGTAPTLAVRLQVADPVSGAFADVPGAVTASIIATGLTVLTVYPGIAAVANQAVNQPVPRVYRLAWTIGGTTPSFTFSVGAQTIL
jgi:hypothetical protein